MSTHRRIHARVLILSVIIFVSPIAAYAQKKGFDGIVQHLEKTHNAKRTKIPMLGVANFFVRIIRPAGVKSFKIAVFENQNFLAVGNEAPFDVTMRNLMPKDWQPLVRVNSTVGAPARTYIYAKPSGRDLELMTVVLEAHEAAVIQVKLNPDAVARFMSDPRVMGVSLAGSMRGKSGPDVFSAGGSGIQIRTSSSENRNTSIGRRVDHDNPDYSLDGAASTGQSTSARRPTLQRAGNESPSTTADLDEAGAPLPKANVDATEDRNAVAVESRLPGAEAIKIDTQLVTLNVRAIDRNGQAISTLTREDFLVYENGLRQEISHFDPVTAPINLVLMLDLSGSTRDKRPVMLNAAKKFIDSLAPHDRVAVTAFTRNYYVVSDFTTDRRLLKERIGKLKDVQGGTSFYDAMWTTLDLLGKIKESRKAIVVLTDGVDENLIGDNGGSNRSFRELIERVGEEDVTIYPVHLNPEIPKILSRINQPNLPEGVRERLRTRRLGPHQTALKQLEALANDTAGSLFSAEDESDLDGVYERVAAELRLLYSLAYSPEYGEKDGKFRKINVEVKRDGTVVRTRRGYYAK
ncbi:MAG: VWA domain-containing protein [Blastocatellales bacterium]|nr:VWA domain-containing protein [Blastocatellales bacterium]